MTSRILVDFRFKVEDATHFLKKNDKKSRKFKNGSSKILDFIGFFEGQNVHKI